MSDTDFAKLIEPVARHFWGDPAKGTVTKLSMRFGRQGSKSIDLQTGGWFDHEAGEGGGVIDLVMRETGADKAGAIEWLQNEGFIPPRDTANGSQPRQEARTHNPAPEVPPEPELPVDEPQGIPVNVQRYPYTDGDGGLLYEVVRQQFKFPDGSWQIGKNGGLKKSFWQRRPDGKGGWINSLGDVKHTIYRRQAVEIAAAEGKMIGLCEGEKDVHTLESWGLIASTNSGGAANWKPEFAGFFRGADVVILGDDDEPGRKRVETVAMSLRGIAARVRVVGFWDGKKDVTDWKDAGHTADELSAIIGKLPDWRPAVPASTMGAVGLLDLDRPDLKHDHLVVDTVDRQGIGMMPGASGSGKTFIILELGGCVSCGLPFFGKETKQGLVLYQAGEGKQGVAKRLKGWMQDRGITPDASIPFKMLTKRVNLFLDDKDADSIIAEGKIWSAYYGVPTRLVIIDTYNKAITGANEISGLDMGKVLARMERISVELDCMVIAAIHKSAKGEMRGHTSLTGDVANVLNVSELQIRDRNNRIIRTMTLDKNKDGEKGRPLRFVLRQVVLGDDETGKPITTCVVDRPDADEEEYVRQGRLTYPHIIALKAMRQAIEDHGEPAPNGLRAGSAVRMVVKYAHWQDMLRKLWQFTAPEDQAEKRAQELHRAIGNAGRALLAGDYIGRDNDLGVVWLTGKDERPKPQSKPIDKPKPSPLMTPDDLEVPF